MNKNLQDVHEMCAATTGSTLIYFSTHIFNILSAVEKISVMGMTFVILVNIS